MRGIILFDFGLIMVLRFMPGSVYSRLKRSCYFPIHFFMIFVLAGCSHWIFFPQKIWQNIPEMENYQYDIINIKTRDGILLNAWLMPQRQGLRKGAIIYFHGNAENISINAKQVFWLTDYGYDVLLVDYRGYGHSGGEVDLDKTMTDIADALQWFVAHYDANTPKYLIAHSLGASMSGYVIATEDDLRKKFSAVVLDAGFSSYQRIMREVMSQNWFVGLFKYPASMVMPKNYDLIDVIGQISPTPLVIIHGKSDPVVPFQHGADLFGNALSPKIFLSYEGYHLTAFDDIERRKWLVNYLQLHVKP